MDECVTQCAVPGASPGVPVAGAQPWLGVRWSLVVAPDDGGHGRPVGPPDGAQCRGAELGVAVLLTARLETRTKESMELAGSLVS